MAKARCEPGDVVANLRQVKVLRGQESTVMELDRGSHYPSELPDHPPVYPYG